MENGDTSTAPSTLTASIAATIWSPVTSAGPWRTPAQGRPGWLRSYAWTWESNVGMTSTLHGTYVVYDATLRTPGVQEQHSKLGPRPRQTPNGIPSLRYISRI